MSGSLSKLWVRGVAVHFLANMPIREKLKGLIYVPIKFDTSGSKIVMYQPNGLG